jgi:glycosyltransferase involved in cell wall biosynthesis
MLDLSVVVPVRNAERLIEECLASIVRAEPREIIVVDGLSTDRTREIAQRYPVRIMSDEGRGVAAARAIGAEAAQSPSVALIDVDIVLPDGGLAQLLDEFHQGGSTALQAGLHSVSGPGYWGQALAQHHNYGRSKNWPGVMATIFDRAALLKYGFDQAFLSGEDIELRWRLRQSGARIGVSRRTVVTHRFEDTWEFARGQWLADGEGLARMVMKHGWRGKILLGLPLAGAVRGILLSLLRREPKWLPYWLSYAVGNYIGMLSVFGQRLTQREPKVAAA